MNKFSSYASPNSLRGQLLLWLLAPLLVIGLLAIYDGYRAARSTADSVSDRVLSGSALAIAERVFVNDDNDLEVDIPYVALQMLTSSEDDRVFYRIENIDGTFVTGYRDLELPENSADLPDITFHDGRFRGDPIRIALYSGAAASNTRSFEFRVGIAETTNARSAIAQSILVRSLLRQAALLLGAAILVWWAVTRTLRPLQKVEQAIGRRSPNDVRPIEHKVPNEVNGLVFMINDLVARFAASIGALQNFTSNASHQFRTPLALIKTHLAVAMQEQDPAKQKEAIKLANGAVGDAERLMSQMLVLARLDTASKEEIQTHICDLSEVARDVCEEFVLQLATQAGAKVDLGFQADDPVFVMADRTLTQEIVRNLIDNSIKHSGKQPRIDVIVEQSGTAGVLTVRDDGVGFDPDKVVNDPTGKHIHGMGGSRSNMLKETKTNEGLGLGLSIVNEIAGLLNATFEAKRNASHSGMNIEVRFALSD